MEEVVQTLAEEGALSGERGNYRLEATPPELHISPTVQGVLAARIDRLAPDEKALLQQLSVIGRAFPLRLVQGVVSLPEDTLYRVLVSLQRKEFLYEQPAFPEVEYVFKHALTQDVAYGTVLHEQRKALHERTGQAMEELNKARVGDHYSELAHHYSRSGNAEKAVAYLGLAGHQTVQRSATSSRPSSCSRPCRTVRSAASMSSCCRWPWACHSLPPRAGLSRKRGTCTYGHGSCVSRWGTRLRPSRRCMGYLRFILRGRSTRRHRSWPSNSCAWPKASKTPLSCWRLIWRWGPACSTRETSPLAALAWSRGVHSTGVVDRAGLSELVGRGNYFPGVGAGRVGAQSGRHQPDTGGTGCRQATGSELWRSQHLALLAEAYGQDAQVEEGLRAVAEALAVVERTEERCSEAELYRLQGELTLGKFKVQL